MREKITILSERLLILIATSYMVFLTGYFSLGRILGIHKYDRSHMLIGLSVITLILLWFRQEQTKKVWSVTVFLAIILAITWFWGIDHLKAFGNEYTDWFQGSVGEHKEWENIYYFLQISLIAVLSTIVGAILQYVSLIRKIMTFILAAVPVISYFVEYPLSQRAVAFILIFFLMLWIQWKQEKWEKCRSESRFSMRNRAYMFYLTPFLLLFSLILCVVPVKQEPLKWTIIRNIIARIEEGIQRLNFNRGSYLVEDFDNLLVKMNENTDLRGKVEEKNKLLMTIHMNGTKYGYLYLTGSIMATFDGREWTETKPLTEEDIYPDTYELKYAVRRSEGLFGDYYSLINIDVEYEKFHSQDSFLPLKANEWTNADPLFGKNKMLGFGSTYKVSYWKMNLDSGLFDELLMNTPEDRENVWLSCQPIGEKRMSFEKLLQYREKMYTIYGSNPNLSKETEAWKLATLNEALLKHQGEKRVEELTAYEKFRIWEKALSEFMYTKEPGELPQYVQSPSQFMDYFLLESKKGYCTYFATALVMLARSEGYPARLSQGFAIPYEGEEEMKVYGDRAHAWPEIYFEGVGWIPFEPTPGYAAGRYQPWKVSKELYDENDYLNQTVIDKEHNHGPEQVQSQEEEKEVVPGQEKVKKVLAYIIRGMIAVVFFAIFVVLVMFIYLRVSVYRFKKKGMEERFLTIFNKNISMLEKLGYKREETETITEFAQRIKEQVNVERTLMYREEVLYGQKEITKEMNRELWKEQKELLLEMQKQGNQKLFLIFEKILVASLNEYV